jgi:hypothetical protein
MWGFRRLLVALVGLITLALAAPWGAPKAVADGDRLGCTTYCQNAGGYGSAVGPQPPPAVTLENTGTVTADADGYVPVTLRCNLPGQCAGVLMLDGGRSDLLVNGGATRTIGVPLSPQEFASLKSNGPTTLYLNIDAGQAPGTRGTQCGDWNLGCKYQANGGAPSGFSLVTSDKLTVAAPG